MKVPEFGIKEAGIDYINRPCAYGILIDSGKVGLVKTHRGYFLPGGGARDRESLVECLRRELREECGIEGIDFSEVCKGMQYVHALGEGYFQKIESFFSVPDYTIVGNASEADHDLQWLDYAAATNSLHELCQQWAVRSYLIDRIVP